MPFSYAFTSVFGMFDTSVKKSKVNFFFDITDVYNFNKTLTKNGNCIALKE